MNLKLFGLAVLLVGASAAAAVFTLTRGTVQSDEPHVPDDLLRGLISTASSEQRDKLSDGVISPGEYESAVHGTANCLRAAGVSVEGPSWQGRYLRLVYSAPSAAAMAEARAIYADCFAAHEREVAQAWSGKATGYRSPSEGQREKYWDVATACMRADGLEIPEAAEFRDVASALQKRADAGSSAGELVDRCHRQGARAAGIPTE